jgi:hypothetical protein
MKTAGWSYAAILFLIVAFTLPSELQAKRYRDPSNVETLQDDADQHKENQAAILSSGNTDEDLNHYQGLTRRFGAELGMFIPFGDFENMFDPAPMVGIHAEWAAIQPLVFTLSMQRASAPHTGNAGLGKLSVTSINIGTMITLPARRFIPYFKLEGGFYFNDVDFNDPNNPKYINSGNDINLTTVGVNVGLGMDFIVGREISIGLDVTYHYPIPKQLSLSDGTTFNLGSPWATVGLRLNF